MFTTAEESWLKALIETMRGEGYRYYVAHTVTQSGNDYDVVVIFSKSPITGYGLYGYTVLDGVMYSYDSSGYSSYNSTAARVSVTSYSGDYAVNQYEHVYTNAEFGGYTLQPDIRQQGGVTHEPLQAVPYLIALLLLVLICFRIFR